MNDFRSAVARLFQKKTYLRVLLATLILTLGVYFAFPPFGITACFPIPFFCGALSFLVFDRIAFAAVAGPIAFFYGMMMGYPSPLLFAAALLGAGLCGAVFGKAVFFLREKKGGSRALWGLIPALVIGLCIPLLFAGDPFRYASQRARVEEYLESIYPEQHFDKVQLFYDPTLTAYRASVHYSSGEGELESELIFAEDVLDGYYEDYAEFVLLKSKTDLIEAFRASDVSCIVEGVAPTAPFPTRPLP